MRDAIVPVSLLVMKLALVFLTAAPSFSDKIPADPLFLSFVRDLRAFGSLKANLLVCISYHFEQTGSWIVVGAYIWRTMMLGDVLLVLLDLQVLVGKNLRLQRRWR